MLLIDGHLDLAMNAVNWDRNLDLDVRAIRLSEAGLTGKGRGCGTTAFPEMRQARMAVSLATVIARTARPNSPAAGASCQEISFAKAQGQLGYYRVLEQQGKVRMITDRPGLRAHLDAWSVEGSEPPLGFILSMEGADPIVWPEQAATWWECGLRVVGLSHYGVSAYAHGTGTTGGLTDQGRPLLEQMEQLGMVLDLTHLADRAFWETLDAFGGPVIASHNNCRALVPGDRQFDDDQIRAIVDHSGVIGAALDAWMLFPGWVKGQTPNTVVGISAVADHIDHVCQLAGSARHAAIGSDLDGGYGTEQCPHDLDTVVDLLKIADILRERGYAESDVEAVMWRNWVRLFDEAWT